MLLSFVEIAYHFDIMHAYSLVTSAEQRCCIRIRMHVIYLSTANATLADGAAVEQNFEGCEVTVMGGDQIRHIYNFIGTVNILNTNQESDLNAFNLGE